MTAPVLLWLRRDLRLSDHPALRAAMAAGPVIPVFVLDPETEALGSASRWRLGLALESLAARLEAKGSRLVLRRGPAVETLLAVAGETGAAAVHWSRLYAPAWVGRDAGVKAALRHAGVAAESHPGHLLHEPWSVATKAGGPFAVFTPFWRAAAGREVGTLLPEPRRIDGPASWPRSERLGDWRLGAGMDRGGAVVRDYSRVGEAAARERLDEFLEAPVERYAADRDRPDRDGTSRLSESLTWGEVSPRTVWLAAERTGGGGGADAFRRELVWREFAWHLLWHHKRLATDNWRGEWDGFPWRADNDDAERWRRGMTGEPMVDAGMRELYVTGTMHNRVRMLVASYLTKHLLTDWRVGRAWFEECLIDWDPAANAMNWQWVAGSGPDATPFFRVFSPERQAERFDPDGIYRRRFLDPAEAGTQAFFAAVPRSWGLDPEVPYPAPIIGHSEGRRRALAAYEAWRAAAEATTR